MVVAGVLALCIILAVLAFLAPRLSRHPQNAATRTAGAGSRGASKAPRKLGTWLSKPFQTSQKMMNKSAEGGRKGRGKLPL